ncbi:uncharacterized protein [Apostichopus japonicus]|uniref:uncharacterized protein isoform X2 n=1 Tax=Stichopus japonicus TaxID=307972 RepID=UPI003AB3C647
MEPGQQPIDQNAQVYAKSNGIIQREYQEEAVLYTAYAPNPFKSMPEREILDYKKEIADKTGQDVKQIELIVQAEETEIKETKEERGWREDQITENYNQDCDHSWRFNKRKNMGNISVTASGQQRPICMECGLFSSVVEHE